MLNLLNAELNTICHLLTLLGAHPIFHISRIRVKGRLMMRSHSSEKLQSSLIHLVYIVCSTLCRVLPWFAQVDGKMVQDGCCVSFGYLLMDSILYNKPLDLFRLQFRFIFMRGHSYERKKAFGRFSNIARIILKSLLKNKV
jgi:hypothetical protein